MKILLCLFSLLLPALAIANEKVSYSFEWIQPKDSSLELKLFLAPLSMAGSAGKHGEYKEDGKLPVVRALTDQKLEMRPGEQSVLYLVAKNNSKKKVRFFVVPHEISPPEASLGFHFNCLCFNHVYTVAPGKLWYRVMLLKTEGTANAGSVSLKHRIVWHK